jgi:adenosylcobyric acid synthase
VETTLSAEKRLEKVEGASFDEAPLAGYEMHIGVTEGPDRARPFARLGDGSPEGAMTADGRVVGTYIHGLFADDRQRAAWLERLGAASGGFDYEAGVDETLDRLAAHLEKHVDLDRIIAHAE